MESGGKWVEVVLSKKMAVLVNGYALGNANRCGIALATRWLWAGSHKVSRDKCVNWVIEGRNVVDFLKK